MRALLDRVSIRSSLYALFGLSAIVMCAQSIVSVWDAWKQVNQAERVIDVAGAGRQLFEALHIFGPSAAQLAWRLERRAGRSRS